MSSTTWQGLLYSVLVIVVWGAGLAVGFIPAVAVLVAAGFLTAMAGLRYHSLGLIGVSTLCTLDAVTRVFLMKGGLLRWNTFNYWLLIVMVTGAPLLLRRRDPHTRLLMLFFGILFLWLALSLDHWRGILHILNGITVFGLLVYCLRAERDELCWFWMAVVNGLVAAGGGFIYFLDRADLGYIDRNALSHFPMTALFTAALGFPFASRLRFGQPILVLLSSINFGWAFLTTSRGGTLISACCLLYMLSELKGVRRRVVLLAAALLMTLVVLDQFPELRENTLGRLGRLFDTSYSMTKRTSGRSDLALAGWNIFLDEPVGIGTGGFARYWAEYSLTARNVGMRKGHGVEYASHNVWIKVLTENGPIGFLAFASFVLSFAYVGWRSKRMDLLRLGLLVTVSLTVAFNVTEFQAKGLWLLVAGAAVLIHRQSSLCNVMLLTNRSGNYSVYPRSLKAAT